MTTARSVDPGEIARFARLAGEWWDANGKMRPLHRMNPCRLGFIRDAVIRHFRRTDAAARPLEGLAVLDIGCGGGILSEPLARMGGSVTGVDPAEDVIAVARSHAAEAGLAIDYRVATLEDLVAAGELFDLVTALEVVEHVADMPAFVADVAAALKPGGLAVFSTLDRTLRSFALAIVGAEYVLRWLPVGTHDWRKFVRPEELAEAVAAAGLTEAARSGMIYDPLAGTWRLGDDTGVNYILAAAR